MAQFFWFTVYNRNSNTNTSNATETSVINDHFKWSAERFMSIYKAIHKCQYLHNILSFKISRLKAIQQHMMWWKEIWRHQMTKRYNKIQYGTKHGEQSAKTSHLVPSSCVAWHDGHKNHQVAERTYILVKHRAETATTIITTFMHVKLLTYKLSYYQVPCRPLSPKRLWKYQTLSFKPMSVT